mmetsp:Transcript_24829/g.44659  ORF Transcript_24829/g.44659 Transcript_24829/m.44659 type:complete len:231 (+) Transcript_24829:126-818(+)|eukprot:CAMPEP_0201872600 /NCGR_PEP_ID=MMETSP0902-20130614/5285_1 /ASSEMBLY_ACC=CAM_ASM_000551 /TAXON_ID=420261 /ORGANISM="Thalassiosira antarctica, Strain CCMP982" /LENGTH=230 /DNA_ID=CAMNT_0048398929 /DNA_START=94 /DNA_END=786 /DNA_ORIENTATION=+
MNLVAFGAHFNASRGLRSLAARTNVLGRPLANTSRTVITKACSPSPMLGRHHLILEKCTRHCYRKIHDKPSGSSSSTFRERLGDWRSNGTPEIALGSIILALVGIDYVLQVRNDQDREDAYRQLERNVRRDEATTRKEDKKMLDEGVAANFKFKCIIRKAPENFDGHKCLKNVKVGDIVNVIEEGVGPDGQYNMCAIERGAVKHKGNDSSEDVQRFSIGWFPCSCLQKIE